MLGTIINTGTVIGGSLLGLLIKGLIPDRIGGRVMQGIGLFTLVLGFDMVKETGQLFIVLISLVFGAIVGELVDLDAKLNSLGHALQDRFKDTQDKLSRGFVTSSLLFCVGPMAILGAIENGLSGDYTLLLTKSVMDGISSIAFASTLGVGVLFSSLSVLFYQGGITLLAGTLRGLLTAEIIAELTAVGGVLIIGLAFNILEMSKLKIANLLPALLFPLFLTSLFLN